MSFKRAVCALAVTCALATVASALECKPSVKGATWDLTPLSAKTLSVTGGDIECTYNKEEKNYNYAFNPCGVATVASTCKSSDHCPLDGTVKTAAVIQMDGTKCCVAGSTAAASMNPVDTSDRSKGVQVIFKGGRQCTHPVPTPRQTTINIMCDTRAKEPRYDHATEPSHCQYDITMFSIHGCPTECPIEKNSGFVCGGHGICRTDAEVDAVRCFCDDGYSGSDCGTKGGSSQAGYGGIIAILIILFILMIGMGGVIFYLAKQMMAFKKDNDMYMSLRENEGGKANDF